MRSIFQKQSSMLQLNPKQPGVFRKRSERTGMGSYFLGLFNRKDSDIRKTRRPSFPRGQNKNGLPISFVEMAILIGGLFAAEANNVSGSGSSGDASDPITEKKEFFNTIMDAVVKYGRSVEQYHGDLLDINVILAIIKHAAIGKECICHTPAYRTYCGGDDFLDVKQYFVERQTRRII